MRFAGSAAALRQRPFLGAGLDELTALELTALARVHCRLCCSSRTQAAVLGRMVWRRLCSRSFQRRGSQWLPRRSRKHRRGALAFCKGPCCIISVM